MDSTFASRVEKVADELADLLRRKNEAYGDSFHRQYQKYGLPSALIRMDDKIARLENLYKAGLPTANGESVRDTLMDLAGYALLAVMEMANTPVTNESSGITEEMKGRVNKQVLHESFAPRSFSEEIEFRNAQMLERQEHMATPRSYVDALKMYQQQWAEK